MKKIILFCVVIYSISIKAQISSLTELATGEIEIFSPIYELDKSIYGYFMVSFLDNVDKEHQKYEYVLLDKNLNKVANGEFIDIKYKKYASSFLSPEKIGNKIILSKVFFIDPNRPVFFASNSEDKFVSNRILDLSTNVISAPFYQENSTIIEGERDLKKLKKTIKENKFFEYPLAIQEGFILNKRIKSTSKVVNYRQNASIEAFNIEKERLWEYNYNQEGEILKFNIESVDDENIIFWTQNVKTKSQVLRDLNPKTGKANFAYELENKKSKYSHFFKMKPLKDNFVIVGMFSKFKSSGFDYKKGLGFFKIVLDKNGKEISKKYLKWENMSNHLDIKKNGKLEKGYRLLAKQFFVFEDGSVTFLTEKFKDTQNFVVVSIAPKTTDFLVLNFDKEFTFNSVEKIEKDKSYYASSDYLYSQIIKDGNGVVFFYRDYKKDVETKKKNWVLGIVTIINGKMTQEQIPMSSEEHFISPYIAKEGYILLREYNKDSDYDEIRLEKLNY